MSINIGGVGTKMKVPVSFRRCPLTEQVIMSTTRAQEVPPHHKETLLCCEGAAALQ